MAKFAWRQTNSNMMISSFKPFAVTNNLINFENNERIKVKQKATSLFLWLMSSRFLLASVSSNDLIWAIIGNPFHYTNDRVLFNLVILGLSSMSTFFHTILIKGKINSLIFFN